MVTSYLEEANPAGSEMEVDTAAPTLLCEETAPAVGAPVYPPVDAPTAPPDEMPEDLPDVAPEDTFYDALPMIDPEPPKPKRNVELQEWKMRSNGQDFIVEDAPATHAVMHTSQLGIMKESHERIKQVKSLAGKSSL